MRAVLSVAAVLAAAQFASADIMGIRPSAAYIPAPTAVGSAPDTVGFSDGFETYGLGAINGQGGYTVFAANAAAPVVSNANPAAGQQHLRITKGLGANTSLNGAFTADFGNFANKSATVSVDVNLSSTGGASAQIIAQAPGQALLSWRAIFDLGGNIFVLDDADGLPGGALAFINTNAAWTPNVYRNFRVELDSTANAIRYFYNNALIYSASAGIFAGTAVEQVILASDNAYAQNQTLDYDNLNIIPAPSAAALLLGAGVLSLRRRRR